MAVIVMKKKRRKRELKRSVETPVMNLITGKLMYKYRQRKLQKLEGQVERYTLHAELVNDESPIQRIRVHLTKHFKRTESASSFTLPVPFWELLVEQLRELIPEIHEELESRGVSKLAYKLKTKR